MAHLLMQVLVMSIFNKETGRMDLFWSGQIKRWDKNAGLRKLHFLAFWISERLGAGIFSSFCTISSLILSPKFGDRMSDCTGPCKIHARIIFILFPDLHAFEVECEFTETEGRTVIRSVDWNKNGFIFPKTEEERCTDPSCFSHIFRYLASNEQIEVWLIRYSL